MATDDTANSKKAGKGFAGLSTMVSDVDATLEKHAAANPTAAPAPAAGATARPSTARSAVDQEPRQYADPSPPSTGGASGLNWILGVAAVLGAIWFFSKVANTPSTRPTPSYSDPAPATSAASAPRAMPTAPPPAAARPSRLAEEKPPPGRDNVLAVAQIRYCLSEDIRMEAAKPVVNDFIDADIDRFNAMVEDYNIRCGSFKYRRGALEAARSEVETNRAQLQAEGRARFVASSRSSSSTLASAVPEMDETTLRIQARLNALGFDTGTPDGFMGPRTRNAILAFQRSVGLPQHGLPDEALLSHLRQAGVPALASQTAPSMPASASESKASAPTHTQTIESKPSAPASPSTGTAARSQSSDRQNFSTCISGNYPSLCKHHLLTPEEADQVGAAERRANFNTCISGNYPSLCKHTLLTSDQASEVEAAERRANLRTCMSGSYSSLCKHSLLTPGEAAQVAAAERRANYTTCISGNYTSLCKHSLLTPEQASQVDAAERRANYNTCISGNYPSLCKHSLLSPDESIRVADAERRARSR